MKNKFIYAIFLGLYLMGEQIPKFVRDYISVWKPETENKDLFIVFQSLINAPDLNDKTLRSIVLKSLQ